MKKRFHPRTGDSIRAFLAKNGFFSLIVIYVILTSVVSLILAVFYHITSLNKMNFLIWWQFAFLQLYDITLPVIQIETASLQFFVLAVGEIFKVVLPSLLLGATVFKFFISPKVFTFRNSCSVFFHEERKENVLAVRLYSSTRLTLLDLQFRAIARLPRQRLTTLEPYIKNVLLRTSSIIWPVAITHTPYTLYIPLMDSDIGERNGIKRLYCIQGHGFENELILTILVTAKAPELGSEIIESFSYSVSRDIEWKKFDDIIVDFRQLNNAKSWKGWDTFDANANIAVIEKGDSK